MANITEYMADKALVALTPRQATGYGPGQPRFRPALTDPLHFRTCGDHDARRLVLERFDLSPAMRLVQRRWSSTYTQALYTDHAKAKSVNRLRGELLALIEAAEQALAVLPGKSRAGKRVG